MPAPAIPQEISLTLFGGTDSSLSPATLPEGLSPACNDVIFAPGLVGSRPCLQKVFGTPFTGNPSVLYGKKYLQANGLPLNLYLDSLGVLRFEDPVNNPGVGQTIQNVSPAVKTFKSVTFDGVEYIAFSDGAHGVDVPRFYDTELNIFDRVSKDGVGSIAGLTTAADVNTTVNITSVTFSNVATISSISETGNIVTVTTSTPHGFTEIAGFVLIAGVGVAGYNGLYQIASIPSATTFTTVNAGTGLASSSGGSVGPGLVTVVTSAPHTLNVGDAVVIQGSNSSFNNSAATTSGVLTPNYWTVVQVVNSTTFVFGLTGPSGTINTTTFTNGGAQGSIAPGGQSTIGTHQLAVSFLWRGGYITRPSPPITFSSVGNKQVLVQNLPLGPPGVLARILHLTGSGGGNFFSIPAPVTIPGNTLLFNGGVPPSITIKPTWVMDNTSTSVILDFPDNTLFAALAGDVPGNNLFALVTLAPCLGFDAYASRLFAWGEINNVKNVLNFGFEGGVAAGSPNVPLGWNFVESGGALIPAPNGFGLAYQMTGAGPSTQVALITQQMFQDYLGQAILQPNIFYSLTLWVKASASGLSGLLELILSSPSTGFQSQAFVNANTLPTTGQFITVNFPVATPATIPSDIFLSVAGFGLPNGATIVVDELAIFPTNQPYRLSLMRGSYVNNPESFDGVTGDIGPTQDPTAILDTFQIRQTLNLLTQKCWHRTSDNGSEPSTWTVDQIEFGVGAPSIHSAAVGSGNWAAWICDTGKSLALRVTQGADSYKISREMKTYFQAANMNAKRAAWLANVDDESQAGAGIMFMGIAQGSNLLPTAMAVLDYFESDTGADIQTNRPLHIGFTGKMLTTDLGRKWTVWNLPMCFGAVLARSANIDQFCVGSGPNASGQSFGNVYTFSNMKFTDDDYGRMFPSYTTYFFVNHDTEQQLQLGGKLHLYGGQFKLAIFVTGIGFLVITPLANTIANKVLPQPSLVPWAMSMGQVDDIEIGFEVTARRCAFQISVVPLPNTTDVNFSLSHLSVPIMAHPTAKVAGLSRNYP